MRTKSTLLSSQVCLVMFFMGGMGIVGCSPSSTSSPPASPKNEPVAKNSSKEKALAPIDESIDVQGLLDARLAKEELDLGWIRLFDGQSMFGWKPSSNANWRVEDGKLVVDQGDRGFLFTTSRFGDFELKVEFLAEATTNSGLFLRSPLEPKAPEKDCFELNIAPTTDPFPTGSLVKRQKVNDDAVGELDPGEWHTLHALVDGNHVRTWVDGHEAVDYQDETGLSSGYLGLQFREGKIQFREIKVRPITYTVLPAKDLADWKSSETEGFRGDLEEKGGLRLAGGKGHMELMQTLDNFWLQAEATTLAPNVNSGIFVRCIPGEPINGYECQVHHGFDGDRRRPVDAGMGAIFRRQAARAVLSDEGTKAHITIAADGPHLATWVEGIQVVDWTDTRAPHENPRQGLRMEAGTIQLQSHDPSCDVRFESLKLSPIP